MSGSRKTALRDYLSSMGLAGQAGLLAAALLLASFLLAPIAYAASGGAGVASVAVGAGVCLVGAELGLLISGLLRGPGAAMVSLALAMLSRTLIPLVLGVTLHLTVPMLASSGMIFYLLVFYLLALTMETALMLAKIPPRAASGEAL